MKFIKTLEITRKVHELRIAFKLSFQYNKVEIRKIRYSKKIESSCGLGCNCGKDKDFMDNQGPNNYSNGNNNYNNNGNGGGNGYLQLLNVNYSRTVSLLPAK